MSPYTLLEKMALADLYEQFCPEAFSFGRNPNPSRQHKICKVLAFNKDETYPDIKFFRSINGRHDLAKIFFGPIIKSIESRVYNSQFFIKHISWSSRAKWFKDKFERFKHFYMTDYSSFEASFTYELCCAVELPLYTHMVGKEMAVILMSAFYGTNTSTFADVSMRFQAKRCSGDVNTSLGNAWCNLCVIHTLLHDRGVLPRYRGCNPNGPSLFAVEGDDGFIGSNVALHIAKEDFEQFGLTAKIETVSHFYLGSFCGMVFDPDSLTILADPIKAVLNFGWASGRYASANLQTRLSLLRAKALSFAYLYPRCPLISAIAKRALQLTRGVRVRAGHMKETGKWGVELPKDEKDLLGKLGEPTLFSRAIVDKLWGIDISAQVRIENSFSKLPLGPWSIPEVLTYIPKVCQTFIHSKLSYSLHEHPVMPEPNMTHFIYLLNRCIKLGINTRPVFNPKLWFDLKGNFSKIVVDNLDMYV